MAAASAMAGTSSETTSEEQVITQEPKEANSTTAQKKSKQRKRGRRGAPPVPRGQLRHLFPPGAEAGWSPGPLRPRVTITAWDIQIAVPLLLPGRWAGSSSPTARRPFSERQYMPYSNRKSEYADRRTKTVRNML
ncbi:Histone H2B type W-T [Plecturocebus cupreus]